MSGLRKCGSGSIFEGSIYRQGLTATLGDDLPPDALLAARNTLGGAVAVAENLPEQLGATLARVSRNAFIEAFQTTAMVSVAITLIAAAATVLILRRPEDDRIKIEAVETKRVEPTRNL
jgi:MFS transporter, DHA2 family, multidrug resistance protein